MKRTSTIHYSLSTIHSRSRGRLRAGSALVMAIWIIAVLSLLVLNFATEAHLQTSVNLYMRERIRVAHLTDSGIAIAESVILNFPEVQEAADDEREEDLEKLMEDDRWIQEKRELKRGSRTTIGPIVVDKENPSGGTVTIEIESLGGGDNGGAKLNINTLFKGDGGHPHYLELWEGILSWAGVPEEPQELRQELIDCWTDWRDSDTVKSGDDGAEADWYEEDQEEHEVAEEQKYVPRNGEIPDIKELAKVKGFYRYTKDQKEVVSPLLTGGKWDPDDDDSPVVKNILDILDTKGGQKINVNLASADVLSVIPGIGIDPNNGEPMDEDVVGAIIEARKDAPPDGEKFVNDEDYGPFKDWNDLQNRVPEIDMVANEYLSFKNESNDGAQFKLTITGTSSGLSHSIQAVVYVKEKKLHFIRWQEDP